MGVTVTFVAILELVREGLIELVQAEPFAPLHVRGATGARGLRLVSDNSVPEDSEAGQSASPSEAAPHELAPLSAMPEGAAPSGAPDPGELDDDAELDEEDEV